MSFESFINESGFKVLAHAELSAHEYSIILYLINCAASHLDYVIATDDEFASVANCTEVEVRAAIDNLDRLKIVKIRYGSSHRDPNKDSMRIGLQTEVAKWELSLEKPLSTNDALIFPFHRKGKSGLQLFTSPKKKSSKSRKDKKGEATWKRVMESFLSNRVLANEDLEKAKEAAQVLVETHAVDQILILIRHFGSRIPSLSLLASSWFQYWEVFEEENQKVDLVTAKRKHFELDEELRRAARSEIKKASEKDFSEEELGVLDIFLEHNHPRRQLFWAFQARSRYPKLQDFFKKHSKLMLQVSSSGKIVKKFDEN